MYKLKIRKTIYKVSGDLRLGEIIDQFKNKDISERTIFRTIKYLKDDAPFENKLQSGQPKKLSAKMRKKIVKFVKITLCACLCRLANKFQVSNAPVSRILKKNKVEYHKHKRPKHTVQQLKKIPRR